MTRSFSIKPTVLALGALFGAALAQAQDSKLGSTCLDCRPEQTDAAALERPPVVRSGAEALPPDYTRVTADEIRGQTNILADAVGSVIVERNDVVLNADWAAYRQQTQTVTAGDKFILEQQGSVIRGNRLHYNLDTKSGDTGAVDIETEQNGRRLQVTGEKAVMTGGNRYVLTGAQANTCKRGDASWFIKADTITADYDKGVGVAKNATLVFGGVPVLYTPWADFPLDSNRKSGFLVPNLQIGSDGTAVDIPYYFNLAPNYDATLSVGGITTRGARIGGDFRYLQPAYHGETDFMWLPSDSRSKYGSRYHLIWKHSHQITPHLSSTIDYNRVSDDDYYRDFHGINEIVSNVHLSRRIGFNYNRQLWGGEWQSELYFQKYQTLADINGYKDEPYAVLPKLTGKWQRNIGATQIAFSGELARFASSAGNRQSVRRVVLYPSITHSFHNSWGYIRPKIGLHYTHYNLGSFNGNPGRSTARSLPVVNIDSGMTFERTTRWRKTDYIQTLEPRLFYNYVPAKAQNDLPNFDSSENSFTYEQLFRENLYSGNDRINSANSLTAAVQTRLLLPDSGEERYRAGIGQKFYFTDDNVLLDGSISSHSRNRSDWVAFGTGRLNDNLTVDTDIHYNASRSRLQNFDIALRYHPQPGKALHLRYKYGRDEAVYLQSTGYYRDKLSQIDIGAQWPLKPNLHIVARTNWDLTVKRPIDQLLGLEYRSPCGCWSAGISAQRYVTGWNSGTGKPDYKNAFFFNLILKDLSGVGNRSIEQLRRAVPDYTPSEEINP